MCLLSKLLNLFGCKATKRETFRIKMLKNLLRNHKLGEADTFHACLLHYPLHELCFCFDQIRTGCCVNFLSFLCLHLANITGSVCRTIGPLV